MTVAELAKVLGLRSKDGATSVRMALKAMPDAYIDRWTQGVSGWVPVWDVVVPPEDCPKPEDWH